MEPKEKEYKLLEKETNAKVNKYNADADLVRQESKKALIPSLSKEQQEVLNRETDTYKKLEDTFNKVQSSNEQILGAISEGEKLVSQGKKKETGYYDRIAVTAYLQQLDPQSAVLAAEYLGATNINKLSGILSAGLSPDKLSEAINDWASASLTESLQPAQRTRLREAVMSNFATKKEVFHKQVQPILRRVQARGITSPGTTEAILGRPPVAAELDDVTSTIWSAGDGPRQTGAGIAPATQTPAGGVPRVKSKAADLK
jgi:hypothetical protein